MPHLVFVGDRRSPTAVRRGWRWEDGRLAAKQLFDALRANGINPKRCIFVNANERGGLAKVKQYVTDGNAIIGMGEKAQTALIKNRVQHHRLVHPAARGRIRSKRAYIEHVRVTLAGLVPPRLRLPRTHGLVKAGEVWQVEDVRKGALTIKVLSDIKDLGLDDFFDGEIVDGRVIYASVENRMNQQAGLAGVIGCVEGFRTTLCNFMERVS